MGLFDIFKKVKNKSEQPKTENDIVDLLTSGLEIDRKAAMSLPAVSSAVEKVCSTFAMVNFKLYQRVPVNGNEGKFEVKELDDPRERIINLETGDTLDGHQFKKAIVKDYLLGKGGYALVKRVGPLFTRLNYIEDTKITVRTNSRAIDKIVEFQCEGQILQEFFVLRILRNTVNGASGVGYVKEISKAIESAYQAILFQLKLTKSGGSKKGFITTTKILDEPQKNTIKAAWKAMFASDNETRAVILDNGLEFKESAQTPLEMQLNIIRKQLNDEILAVFGLDGDDNKFIKYGIKPIVEAFKVALNRTMLLESEKESGYFWDADLSEITQSSLKERFEAYQIAKNIGAMTPNEIRIKENLNRIEGLDVISMSLGSVLYDVETKKYYVPNTGETVAPGEGAEEEGEKNGN